MTNEEIYNKAKEEGMKALQASRPTPMVVQRHKNMLNDNSRVVYEEVVDGGVCGFAWVEIRPARGKFVIWCRKNGIGSKGYYGGWQINVREGGQSMERKEAYAGAFAKVLCEHGINACTNSRMD